MPGDFGNDWSSLSNPGPASGYRRPSIVADSEPDHAVEPSAALTRVAVPWKGSGPFALDAEAPPVAGPGPEHDAMAAWGSGGLDSPGMWQAMRGVREAAPLHNGQVVERPESIAPRRTIRACVFYPLQVHVSGREGPVPRQ